MPGRIGVVAWIQRKKRSSTPLEARHVEDRVVRHRQAVQREHAEDGRSDAPRIVISNVIGMNAGQLCSGRPPTLIG